MRFLAMYLALAVIATLFIALDPDFRDDLAKCQAAGHSFDTCISELKP